MNPRKYLLTDSGRKVVPETFNKLETILGYRLPDSYKRFIAVCNGGKPDIQMPTRFWVQEQNQWQESIEYIYGISLSKRHIWLPHAWLRNLDFMPRQLLPIARTNSGDPVCLGMSSGLGFKIFFSSSIKKPFVLMPNATDNDILEDEGTIQIAESFSDFIDRLF